MKSVILIFAELLAQIKGVCKPDMTKEKLMKLCIAANLPLALSAACFAL